MTSHSHLIRKTQESDLKSSLASDPYKVKTWWSYIKLLRADEESLEDEWAAGSGPSGPGLGGDEATLLPMRSEQLARRVPIYECAVKHLPGSYKLWFAYLSDISAHAKACSRTTGKMSVFAVANACYERALQFMHKFPRIWKDYCKLLMHQCLFTRTRQTFDRALKALPVTQHGPIWEEYTRFLRGVGVTLAEGGVGGLVRMPAYAVANAYDRYCQFDSTKREELVSFLLEAGHHNEAARQLVTLLNDPRSTDDVRQVKKVWNQLMELSRKHGDKVSSVDLDRVLRTGVGRFPEDAGEMWCALAEMFTRAGNFAAARDCYDEGIETVRMVRAFGIVFDAYARFEEALVKAKVAALEKEQGEEEATGEDAAGLDSPAARDVDLHMERLDALLARRELCLNSVKLRQDPDDVEAWMERIKILEKETEESGRARGGTGLQEDGGGFQEDSDEEDGAILMSEEALEEDPLASCFAKATKTINPARASGYADLWIAYAKHYEKHNDVENSERIMRDASRVLFKHHRENAKVQTAWAEMYLRQERYDDALALMKDAVRNPQAAIKSRAASSPSTSSSSDSAEADEENVALKLRQRLHKSPAVWNMYVDLEESLGSLDTTRAAYDRMISLKVASAQTFLNYAELLRENDYFEDSFRVYERGLAMFGAPQNYEIWLAYLSHFVERFGEDKLERARELFEQCCGQVSDSNSKAVFLMYAAMEEKYGLTRRAMRVYERAASSVPLEERYEVYCVYLQKTEEYFGVVATRPVYERALAAVPDDKVRHISLRFAEMERKLGELDRARAIFVHGSQTCDPKRHEDFWAKWREFELQHGNEVTFKDMLQVKRTIQSRYAAATYSAQADEEEAAKKMTKADEERLEKENLAKLLLEEGKGKDLAGPRVGEKRKAEDLDSSLDHMEQQVKRSRDNIAASIAAVIKNSVSGGGPSKSDDDDDDDEIDIDDDSDDDSARSEKNEPGSETSRGSARRVQQKSVPSAVFGSLQKE